MATTAELIDSIDTTLQFLQANERTLPDNTLRRMRGEAITLGTALLNDRIDDLTTEQVWKLHDQITHIDRIGY